MLSQAAHKLAIVVTAMLSGSFDWHVVEAVLPDLQVTGHC